MTKRINLAREVGSGAEGKSPREIALLVNLKERDFLKLTYEEQKAKTSLEHVGVAARSFLVLSSSPQFFLALLWMFLLVKRLRM